MNRKLRVGINGFGRIGRAFAKVAWTRDDMEVVAINDLGDIHNLAYLFQYDTVYKTSSFDVTADVHENEQSLHLQEGDKIASIRVFQVKNPNEIPWKDLQVDVVVESTGLFTTYDKAALHLQGGARHVVISAPAKAGEDASIKGETVLMCVNEDKFGQTQVTSNASCTTNASSPVIAILDEAVGIEKAILNTVHSYTASQGIVDGPNKKDFREGRAGGQNIVPSSTGAAIAVTKAFPSLEGLFDGISIRVPTPAGSIADITFISKKPTTVEEINNALKNAAAGDKWSHVFAATEEELVSSDIIGLPYASIADLKMTRVVGGNLVKVMAWYDNEMGYTNTLVAHVKKAGDTLSE